MLVGLEHDQTRQTTRFGFGGEFNMHPRLNWKTSLGVLIGIPLENVVGGAENRPSIDVVGTIETKTREGRAAHKVRGSFLFSYVGPNGAYMSWHQGYIAYSLIPLIEVGAHAQSDAGIVPRVGIRPFAGVTIFAAGTQQPLAGISFTHSFF